MVLAAACRAPCPSRSFGRVVHVRLLLRAIGASSAPPPCVARGFSTDADHQPITSSLNDNRIVIVGGGPCGLLMSLYLSKYRVPSVLFEQQTPSERFQHPQAHFLNTRTMEILKFDFPSVYNRVQEAMAPVDEWKDFVFCTEILSDRPPLARVEHPVTHPLVANQDANGILLPVNDKFDTDSERPERPSSDAAPSSSLHRDPAQELSVCSVGHLPQHTLCQILHDHAASCNAHSTIQYGCSITRVESNNQLHGSSSHEVPYVTVSTRDELSASCSSRRAPFVVASDGAHSMVRQSLGIKQAGRTAMQHLINIHVVLDEAYRHPIHRRQPAMLYSVFHPTVIAMVVCHNANAGEYVVQIPYFPPYQTPEINFGEAQVRDVVSAIFGLCGDAPSAGFRIKSVKPWAMSALVASEYYRGRVALVGDAAHVFPPAGGFGMNTGLQDVQNLAWRLAQLYHSGHLCSEPSLQTNQGPSPPLQTMLQQYQAERRSVAQQNAALSTRNYQRLLQVHKAMYLDERHPALLCRTLDAARFLPLAAKRIVFESGFRAALKPLAALQRYGADGLSENRPTSPADWYGSHLVSNLRRVLGSGAGLPLLFPKYELGFSYDDGPSATSDKSRDSDGENQTKRDTWANPPMLRVGALVPHVRVRFAPSISNPTVLDQYPHLISLEDDENDGASEASSLGKRPTFSTSNLPSQLTQDGRPVYVLLLVGCLGVDFDSLVGCLSERLDLDVECLQVITSSTMKDKIQRHSRTLRRLIAEEEPSSFSFFRAEATPPYLVLIRPDSHVHGIANLDTTNAASLLDKLAGSGVN